jgi:hypothetical protein
MKLLFSVDVTMQDLMDFARLSGDWNPLHTDQNYAEGTTYGGNILHGAYSSSLVSRVAGMHMPGKYCLLHKINLRFISPISVPATLSVQAEEKSQGWVNVEILDKNSGVLYVQASYGYSLHREKIKYKSKIKLETSKPLKEKILVIGANGGLGSALMSELGGQAIGTSRDASDDYLFVENVEHIDKYIDNIKIKSIVNCVWPMPDNEPMISSNYPEIRVERYISEPLRQMLALARLLDKKGKKNASLVLVGSTFSDPGSHNYRMPFYTLGKALIPTLVKILAVELGKNSNRSIGVVFDVIDDGMNSSLTEFSRIRHADRCPSGTLPSAVDAAKQIIWLINNQSHLLSGAVINLSGGSLP